MSKFAYFSEELQLSTPFFVKKKKENYQEKKAFIGNQNIQLRKSQNSAFYQRG